MRLNWELTKKIYEYIAEKTAYRELADYWNTKDIFIVMAIGGA